MKTAINWKLIFLLSLFGLVMAFATVFVISEKIEPLFWLVIFALCAYIIVKNCNGRYFLHGFLLSIANSIWITAVHVAFFQTYMHNHPDMANMNGNMPHPRWIMLISGPFVGAVFGLVQGLFAYVASRIMKKPGANATA